MISQETVLITIKAHTDLMTSIIEYENVTMPTRQPTTLRVVTDPEIMFIHSTGFLKLNRIQC